MELAFMIMRQQLPALQRARAAARRGLPARSQQSVLRELGDQRISEIAAQYADAMERGDADAPLLRRSLPGSGCPPSYRNRHGFSVRAPGQRPVA